MPSVTVNGRPGRRSGHGPVARRGRGTENNGPVPLALGIDIGSTNTKVVLVDVPDAAATDRTPRDVAALSAPTPHEARALVATVARLIRGVLSDSTEPPVAVGVTSMAETGVPLAADGEPLTHLLRWDGHSAAEDAATLARVHGRQALFAATGVRPSAKVPLATWARLRRTEPDVHRRMAYWAGTADLVALALTGELVTDHTLAGRTMAYRLPGAGEPLAEAFDAALLDAVGLRPGQLPRVVPADAVAGRVASGRGPGVGWADVARGLADVLPTGTPVVVAGHDHAVGCWAAGTRAPGDRADSVGTAEAVLTILDHAPEPDAVAAAGMSWVRPVSGRHDALLAGTSSAGAMLDWLRARLGVEDLAGHLAAALRSLEDDPEPTGVVVLPYLAGRQTPAPDAAARVLVEPDADGVRLVRAVLEGISLQARWMVDTQAELAGAPGGGPSSGMPSGRGALAVLGTTLAVPAWAETKRRVMPEPLRWVDHPQPVATGAAVLALVRSGALGDPRERLLDAPSLEATTSAPSHHRPYERMYAHFVATALGAYEA